MTPRERLQRRASISSPGTFLIKTASGLAGIQKTTSIDARSFYKAKNEVQLREMIDPDLRDQDIEIQFVPKPKPKRKVKRVVYSLAELKAMPNPPYYSARTFLNHGIRSNHDMNWCMCTRTSLMWHNETLNFWTHFLAMIYFLVQLVLLSFPDVISSQYSDL